MKFIGTLGFQTLDLVNYEQSTTDERSKLIVRCVYIYVHIFFHSTGKTEHNIGDENMFYNIAKKYIYMNLAYILKCLMSSTFKFASNF